MVVRMTKHIKDWFMQGDRRTENRIVEKITLAGLVLTMFIQVGTGVWWASRITTVVDYQSIWITEHKIEAKTIPVLENRVCILEDNVNRLIIKLDKVIDTYQKGNIDLKK